MKPSESDIEKFEEYYKRCEFVDIPIDSYMEFKPSDKDHVLKLHIVQKRLIEIGRALIETHIDYFVPQTSGINIIFRNDSTYWSNLEDMLPCEQCIKFEDYFKIKHEYRGWKASRNLGL